MTPTHVAKASAKASRFIDWLVALLPAPLLDPETFKHFGDADWHQRSAADPFAGLPS